MSWALRMDQISNDVWAYGMHKEGMGESLEREFRLRVWTARVRSLKSGWKTACRQQFWDREY